MGLLPAALYHCGARPSLEQALRKVEAAKRQLDHALQPVPKEWWAESGLKPQQVKVELENRFRGQLGTIVDIKQWEDMGA